MSPVLHAKQAASSLLPYLRPLQRLSETGYRMLGSALASPSCPPSFKRLSLAGSHMGDQRLGVRGSYAARPNMQGPAGAG